MTQIVDALLFAAFAVFCFVMVFLLADAALQPVTGIVLMFLSIGAFGAAAYRATH